MVASINLPLGIRFNNPGNIRNGISWRGAEDTAEGFLKFDHMLYGIRALSIDLHTKYMTHGLRTVEAIVSKYAPPTENDTKAYIMSVCREVDVNPLQAGLLDVKLDRSWNAFRFMMAIVHREQGRPPASYDTYPEWFSLDMAVDAMRATECWRLV